MAVMKIRQADGTWVEVPALVGPKGDPGEKGDPGNAGYTPVKGKDYFTDADKSEIVNQVIAALPVYAGEVV